MPLTVLAADDPPFTRRQDVIYGRKHGVALTMDVFTPKADAKTKANGGAVIWVVSGGWASAHESIDANMFGMTIANSFVRPLVERGYTVFTVVHGSQPKYTIPEILPQINRAVRYIRTNAKTFGIDGERLGIIGASAGGHLSLMQGIAPQPPNDKAPDPVDTASSKVQAVAAFVPPTDFLNYGKDGEIAIGRGVLKDFKAPFDFHELDPKSKTFVPVTDEQKVLEIGRKISPVTHASGDDPPTLIIHGDADKLVPIQQAELIVAKLKEADVDAKLVVKPDAGHGWPKITDDLTLFADWFDKHLKE